MVSCWPRKYGTGQFHMPEVELFSDFGPGAPKAQFWGRGDRVGKNQHIKVNSSILPVLRLSTSYYFVPPWLPQKHKKGQVRMPKVELFSDFGSQTPKTPDSGGVVTGSVKFSSSKWAAYTFPFCRRLVDTTLAVSEASDGAGLYARSGIMCRIQLPRAPKCILGSY